jgi:hypothetical protein
VVYKVDRLSRSLLDFAKLMEVFERHKVSFVSVTQQFNTTHSMGRLTLNILLSFAPVRARDHQRAHTRQDRGGAAQGEMVGRPAGARVQHLRASRAGSKLIFNAEKPSASGTSSGCTSSAHRYRDDPALDELGWVNKVWTTKQGRQRGGKPFDKSTLFNLLTNVVYRGQSPTTTSFTQASRRRSLTRICSAASRRAADHTQQRRQVRPQQVRRATEGTGALHVLRLRDEPHFATRGNSATATTSASRQQKTRLGSVPGPVAGRRPSSSSS